VVETTGSKKRSVFASSPSVCSSSVSVTSQASSSVGGRKKASTSTLQKEIIVHLRAELEQVRSELESNRMLTQKLIQENEMLRTETNSAHARADHFEREAKQLSSPQEVCRRILRRNLTTNQSRKKEKQPRRSTIPPEICSNILRRNSIRQLQFESNNTGIVARATSSNSESNDKDVHSKEKNKGSMIDIELKDALQNIDNDSRSNSGGKHLEDDDTFSLRSMIRWTPFGDASRNPEKKIMSAEEHLWD